MMNTTQPAAAGDDVTLFVGGCHINAYLLDQQDGFVQNTMKLLASQGIVSSPVTSSPVSPRQIAQIVATIDQAKPSRLVLQFGHWESAQSLIARRGLSRRLKRFFRSMVPDPFYWELKDLFDTVTSHSLIEQEGVEQNYESLFQSIRERNIPQVMVMKPFPTLDPVMMRYRTDMSRMIADQSAKYGFQFVDATRGLFAGGRTRPHAKYFLKDGQHLSEEGHWVVAVALADAIARRETGEHVCMPRELRSLSKSLQPHAARAAVAQ
jgi:lysophospholipase L1-like esterase